MNLDKICTDAEFANAVIPVGTLLVFLGYQDGVSGQVTFRYKGPDGNFGNITSGNGNGTGDSVQEYELPVATASVLGGVKIGANLTITDKGTLSAINTTYTAASTLTDGLMTAADKMKLDSLANYEKNKGHYSTAEALLTAHPTANPGDYATVEETDTMWLWDSNTSAWVNSSKTFSSSTAENTSISDAGGYFTATTVEGALQEIAEYVKAANDILNEV